MKHETFPEIEVFFNQSPFYSDFCSISCISFISPMPNTELQAFATSGIGAPMAAVTPANGSGYYGYEDRPRDPSNWGLDGSALDCILYCGGNDHKFQGEVSTLVAD